MEAVSRSVGRLDDLYALTQVTGAPFRRFGQVVANLDAQVSTSQRTYTLAEGRLASQAAVAAAGDVLDSLYAIRDKLGIADGLSVPSQRGDASRFSVQTDITTLVGAIDKRVAQAAVSGLNLVSQPSTAIRIQTTDLGGVTTVTSQPLDSRSLGLAGLSVTDQSATEAARIVVDRAIRQVSTRYEALSNAVQGLSYDDGINAGLVGALSSFGRADGATSYTSAASSSSLAALRRGSLVNLRA